MGQDASPRHTVLRCSASTPTASVSKCTDAHSVPSDSGNYLSSTHSLTHSLTHSSTHSLKGPYPVVPACQEDNRSMKLLFQVMCQDKVTELCADGQREFLKVILESGAGRGQQGNEF